VYLKGLAKLPHGVIDVSRTRLDLRRTACCRCSCPYLARLRKSRQRNNFVSYPGVQQTRRTLRCHARTWPRPEVKRTKLLWCTIPRSRRAPPTQSLLSRPGKSAPKCRVSRDETGN